MSDFVTPNQPNKPSQSSPDTILDCQKVSKVYQAGPESVQVLRDVSFSMKPSEWVSIVGASGSGKSTFLNVVGTLDRPTQGEVVISGEVATGLKENQLNRLRNQHLGFVYQFHHLLAEFTALDNIAMPLMIAGKSRREAREAAAPWLEAVGLKPRAAHKPSELSGGERQRVAIARALVNQPSLVLMDEPTGNLDGETAGAIQSLMQTLNQEHGMAFLTVTHDLKFAAMADRTLELDNGQLQPYSK